MSVPARELRVFGALVAVAVAGELLLAPAASASPRVPSLPVGLFGIPSLHSIIQAIAKGFFGALAGALVPSWLKHGTVATVQHLVALPNPALWPHVRRLQSESTYLAAMLLPVTLTVGVLRYWLVGLTGSAHPATAVTRSVAVTGVLVMYPWAVEQTVAGTNTLTHGILELPAVGDGLQRIIGVLFGGALLSGVGSVFGALLVIIGVIFAAGLFAAQVLMTLILAVLIVAGPPLIVISAIPELSHLARDWAYALVAVALVPVGWTVLFATAGALCLDATSFTGASGGLPGHVTAAFAGLITFVIAGRLPLIAAGQLRQLFAGHGAAAGSSHGHSGVPGSERVRAAHTRLRAVGLEGVPSLGRSVGRAAGTLGAPRGGAVGAARRGFASATRRSGTGRPNGEATSGAVATGQRRGVRSRLAAARVILAGAPRDALNAVAATSRGRAPTRPGMVKAAAKATGRTRAAKVAVGGEQGRANTRVSATGAAPTTSAARVSTVPRGTAGVRAPGSRGPALAQRASATQRAAQQHPSPKEPGAAPPRAPAPPRPPEMHPRSEQTGSSTPSTGSSRRPANSPGRKATTARTTKPQPGKATPRRSRPANTDAQPATPGTQGAPTRRPRP